MCRNYHQESLACATSLFVLILTTASVTFYGRCRMIASKPTRGLTPRILHDEAHRRIVRRQIIMIAEHWDDRYNQPQGDGAGLWAAQPHPQLQQIAGELSPGGALD